MPTTLARDAELVRPDGSHWIALDWPRDGTGGRVISKEDVYPVLTAVWRGADVRVQMAADRYRYSSDDGPGITDWRIIGRDARTGSDEHGCGGVEVTGTARSALADVCRPLVLDWLGTDDYQASRRRTLYAAIMREITDAGAGRHGDPPSSSIRPTITRYRDELDPADADALETACVLLDTYSAATRRPATTAG